MAEQDQGPEYGDDDRHNRDGERANDNCAFSQMGPAVALYRQRDVLQRDSERDTTEKARQHGQTDDEQRFVLVDVDVVEVQHHQERQQHGRGGERDRVQPREAERHDETEARDERHPEGRHVGAWQLREQRRREAQPPGRLLR